MFYSYKKIIIKAFEQKYAIAQVNVYNLELIKTVLKTAEELNSPIFLGVSEKSVEYMGGFKTVVCLVKELKKFYKISVPIILHLDHGSFEGAKKALRAGFNSIMFDGSNYNFKINLHKTKKLKEMCNKKNVLIEAEVGSIGGKEDNIIGKHNIANPDECLEISKLGIDMLAIGIGNIHGEYPNNWTGLDFQAFKKISINTENKIPLVLHGGTGIPDNMIKKAISFGVVKININTEFQIVFAKSIRKYIEEGKDLLNKGFNTIELLKPGYLSIKRAIQNKLLLFGSVNKS
ncbi:class II fructose-bisphosphate aldolase [Candidatus Phytoplasma sacchari]|uniref:Class II fructose-bisphosphate aldolase family protein n=1 Tax=Candidatus Phytoplasma sacchari TaxID=2609813 RepID=A0ABY7M3M5_9MOLU|nr:class II fructose-bisphosphate aldolase [Candidatus Phytoplasma sacchari]KAB8122244.1 class II fructose-bisphosphate aldolase family protein [Candidatus Phytoplasma sacchari]WBL31493.1 class II fructose-bisphosphate aldolase family protein [Candidatus Phytoplasma sacchari]